MGTTFNNMLAQSADQSNANVDGIINQIIEPDTEENNTEEISESSINDGLHLSSEEIDNLTTELNNKICDGEIPFYDAGIPFEALKIIFGTLFAPSRLSFRPVPTTNELIKVNNVLEGYYTEDNTIKVAFRVKTQFFNEIDSDTLNYAENIFIHEKNFNELKDYSKLLYSYGRLGLGFIAATLIKINTDNKNEPLNPKFEGAFFSFYRSIETVFDGFNRSIGRVNQDGTFSENHKGRLHIDIIHLYIRAMRMHQSIERDINNWNELGDIMSATYTALYCLLFGSTIKISNDIFMPIENLLDPDSIEVNADKFINGVIYNESMDQVSKNRFISLIYLFNKFTNYYMQNAGIETKELDIVSLALSSLGNVFSNLDDEATSNIDLSVLYQNDLNYKTSFMSFVSQTSFLKNPAIFIANTLSNDVSDNLFNASYIFNYMTLNPDFEYKGMKTILTQDTSDNDFENESIVTGFYTFFLNSIIENLPQNCSPRYFNFIILAAEVFNKIKNSSKKYIKEIGTLGFYQAEGYITYLFNEWFNSGKLYDVDETVKCSDSTALNKINKAKILCAASLNEYLNSYPHSTIYIILSGHQVISNIQNKTDTAKSISLSIDNLCSFNTFSYRSNVLKIQEDVTVLEKLKIIYNEKLSSIPVMIDMKNIEEIKILLETQYRDEFFNLLNDFIGENETGVHQMIVSNTISSAISTNIDKIIKYKYSDDENLNVAFNCLVTSILMVALARDSYTHLIEDPTQKAIVINETDDKFTYDKMIPYATSKRVFNFLNRK